MKPTSYQNAAETYMNCRKKITLKKIDEKFTIENALSF